MLDFIILLIFIITCSVIIVKYEKIISGELKFCTNRQYSRLSKREKLNYKPIQCNNCYRKITHKGNSYYSTNNKYLCTFLCNGLDCYLPGEYFE